MPTLFDFVKLYLLTNLTDFSFMLCTNDHRKSNFLKICEIMHCLNPGGSLEAPETMVEPSLENKLSLSLD